MFLFNLLLVLFSMHFFVKPTLEDANKEGKWTLEEKLNDTEVDRLRQNLLLNYNRLSRPSEHYYRIICSLGLKIRHVEVDESKSTVSLYGYSLMNWTDYKFKWNPRDYGGLKRLFFSQHDIWTPDLFLANSAVSTPVSNYIGAPVVVYSAGVVHWKPQFHFTVLCELNLKYWPYDSQKCDLKFLSWTQSRDHLNLISSLNTFDPLLNSSQWTIDRMSTKRELVRRNNSLYPILWVQVELSRYSPTYAYIIITPTFAIILFILSVFWIPPHSNCKLLLIIGAVVFISTFLFYYHYKLSGAGDHVPSIISFYTKCLALLSLAFIETMLVMRIARSTPKQPLPWRLREYLDGRFGKYFGFTKEEHEYTYSPREAREEEMKDHELLENEHYHNDENYMVQSSKKDVVVHEWNLFVILIDRIFFSVYTFIFLILIITHVT